MKACVKTTKDPFQVKPKPLTQKDIEQFFRPRSGRGACVFSSDVEPVVAVLLDVEAMAALDEPVVADRMILRDLTSPVKALKSTPHS